MSTAIPIFRLSLSNILAGLALTKCFDMVVRSDPSYDEVLLCAFFTLNVINFFHAKIAIAEETRFQALIESHPGVALIETHLTSALWLSFYVQAFFVKNLEFFLLAMVALRSIDVVIVLVDSYIDNRILRFAPTPHLIHRIFWLVYDAFYILFVLFYFYGERIIGGDYPALIRAFVPEILLASVVIDYVIDYWLGKALYRNVRPVPAIGVTDARA